MTVGILQLLGRAPAATFDRNIVTDYGAVGDAQYAFSGLSIIASSKNLSATTALWSSSDVGKGIHVEGAGAGQNVLTTTISAVTDAQNIVLAGNAGATLSASSSSIYVAWGTDDTSKFTTFGASAAAQSLPAVLNLPAQKFFFQTSPLWAAGITTLTVVGQSSVNSGIIGGPQMHLAGAGVSNNNTGSARFQTASSGATQVTLILTSQASKFSVDDWVLMNCVDLQGVQSAFGFPQNNEFINFAKVTSVSSITGVIGLDRPLTHFYSSGYPSYFAGSSIGVDQGGPGTIYKLSSTFNTQAEYRSLLAVCGGQIDARGKDITLTNCTFPGVDGPYPTENITWRSVNSDHSNCNCEVDKLIDTVIFSGSVIRQIACQSGSVNELQITNTLVSSTVNGTPILTTITNSSILVSLGLSPTSYGTGGTATVSGGSITAISGASYTEDGPLHTGFSNEHTMSSGVIVSNSTYGAQRYGVPGAWLMWVSSSIENGTMFQVTNLTQDSCNTYIWTNLSSGFPTVPGSSVKLNLRPHPCPVWNCSSATGSAIAYSLSQAGAQNRPLYEYSMRQYTGMSSQASDSIQLLTNSPNSVNSAKIWGQINFIKINVVTPYTGASALSWTLTQFPTAAWTVMTSSGSAVNFAITINAKVAGLRTIQFSGNTGASSGDTLPTILSSDWWVTGTQATAPVLSANVSSQGLGPFITVEMDSEQGIS